MIENRFSPFLLILRMWKTAGEIFCFPISRTLVSFWERARYRGIPPPPHPSKSRARSGFCKNGLQNIERVRVRGQNIDFKDLVSLSGLPGQTAFALAIICSCDLVAQGQMSQPACGNLRGMTFHALSQLIAKMPLQYPTIERRLTADQNSALLWLIRRFWRHPVLLQCLP